MPEAVPDASSAIAEARPEAVAYPGVSATIDGSGAVVWVESHISQASVAYPITPSTPMGDGFAAEHANGTRNLWDERLEFLETESEHSSASACEGFALAGGRVANFTSGQGLILMKEVLYAIAGKRLPVVFHIGARALTSQALNIHCGHDDVMGVADAGWGILFARNAQEAADLALIARRAAEESETPFLNVQDGFLTTHTLESVRLPEPELMREFIGEPSKQLRPLFDPARPLMSGPVQNQESYMKGKVGQRYFYDRVGPALEGAMREYDRLTARRYGLVRPYRMDDAEYAFVGLGSMMETAEAVVDHLRERGMRLGAVALTSFRPFPSRELAQALARCRGLLVIERADVPLAQSNPLTTELKAALADRMTAGPYGRAGAMPQVYSAVAGLGGSDVRPGHFVAAAERMAQGDGRRFFVLGVKHQDALEQAPEPDVRPAGAFSLRGHSVGGYGSVTTNKVLATLASELFGLQVQAFSKYGSEKKGLPTTYYLTLASERIRVHAELGAVDFVAIQDAHAFGSGEPLAGLREGGTVYLQSSLAGTAAWASLPPRARRAIGERRLRLFVLDGQRIARETASQADLEVRMQGIALLGAFLRLAPFRERAGLSDGDLFGALEKALRKYFGKRGERVVAENLKAARRGYEEVAEALPPPGEIPTAEPAFLMPAPARSDPDDGLVAGDFCERVVGSYARGRDGDLAADEFAARSLVPPSTASLRSFRHLSPEIPEFLAAACVGCMDCVNECPDTAILAKVATPATIEDGLAAFESPAHREELRRQFASTTKYHELAEKRGEAGGLFGLFIDPDKCKGCGECVVVCGAHDALRMAPKSEPLLGAYDRAMSLFHRLPDTPSRYLNQKSLGDMMLAGRSLLYTGGAGSCMGCGEGSAIRMLLAGTGFVYGAGGMGIVAATGCNTVFGSTYPYNPFAVPWTNSLFENAPADAMGIRLRWDQQGHRDRRLWVIGGDGSLFDIGFQSLSRMLMSGMDIKVLVLDTQVYSNTGGQSSMATFTGQNAKMAQFGTAETGKREHRKELALIVMMHPGVFVAQTTPAHINHFYKAILAANEFSGPAVVICYASCMPEHGIGDDQAAAQARLAVESHTFPLLIYDPRRGERIRDRLSLQGNPAVKEDWYANPKTTQPVDFVAFARTEGRFARHFDAAGNPDESLLQAQQDRLANWRMLREMAGV
ncbi:MAG TPA: 2-oxoacid:acceptor oxidoreductase family protein [Candidatus Acidoferrales bacterium]|nr:2-oxoacid:acceptor oxidoreductase family protein [Candidatus Acidoferrales bacterium]